MLPGTGWLTPCLSVVRRQLAGGSFLRQVSGTQATAKSQSIYGAMYALEVWGCLWSGLVAACILLCCSDGYLPWWPSVATTCRRASRSWPTLAACPTGTSTLMTPLRVPLPSLCCCAWCTCVLVRTPAPVLVRQCCYYCTSATDTTGVA